MIKIFPGNGGTEKRLEALLPWLTVGCVAVMLLSLKFRFLDYFIPTTWHGRIGFDYFSVPRSFLNLLQHKSIFNTRFSDFGPYATWYPYHPALSVLLGSWLSLFKPWASYAVFVALSVGALCCSAFALARYTTDTLIRKLAYFLILCSPATYLLLWNGQMHVFSVVSFALVMSYLLDGMSGARQTEIWGVNLCLFGGIICSLLSKPVILPALLALFALRPARKTVLAAFVFYAAVSAVFLFVPALNPQSVGFDTVVDLALHPAKLFEVKLIGNAANISYRREFLNENAIHWLNMRNLMGVVRAENFEFFSLNGFVSQLLGRSLPGFIFKLPALFVLLVSAALFFVKEGAPKFCAALIAVILAADVFYVTYDSVYEYHYVIMLATVPVALLLYYWAERLPGVCKPALVVYCAAAALFYVPTSYFWLRNPALGHHTARIAALPDLYLPLYLNANPYSYCLPVLRWLRVLPALVMFCSMVWLAVYWFYKYFAAAKHDNPN